MSDKPTLEELLEVQEHFGLPSPALVEKDWYVVRALAAVAGVDTAPFRLVFGGGTVLSRAYGLTKRMSEDIDLKIVAQQKPSRGALRNLRRKITDALLGAGFTFDPENPLHRLSMYQGSYTKYQLPYAPIAEGKGALRPEIQIETSVWPLRRPAVDRAVSSFIAEGFGRAPELEKIACSAIVESAAEKLVGLTWRAGSELAGLREERDPTLVRHIYDLHMIREYADPAEVAALALEVMRADAETGGDRFLAYRADPLAETLRAIEGIPGDAVFSNGYAAFTRDMVYGEAPDFTTAVGSLKTLAGHLKKPPA